jgi:alpha-tubulin suppressor-like RCC1 family protein
MTRKYVQDTIPGHLEDDDDGAYENGGSGMPVMIYPGNDVDQVSAGWGSSAILDTHGQVKLVGRPHDLMNLLRLKRLPERVRSWANLRLDPSETTIVGSMISRLIGFASGGDDENWDLARQYSLIHDWKNVDFSSIGDSQMLHVSCSAGFVAMLGTSGTLYTMGLNNRGQCGTGQFSNNVWTPERVVGIDSSTKPVTEVMEQEEPITQVALGFQQGYALTKSGRVYSWGKANRGQLGREIDSDQDCLARPLLFDKTATQIASGLHHAALLTTENQIYVWGKNTTIDAATGRPTDSKVPHLITGMPELRVKEIACGSHHTAILLEDGSVYGVGIASDEAVPLLDPVLLLEPGILELPLRQFAAHHDRTTIIDNQGHVFQAHLWKDERLREYAAFTPTYVDTLLGEGVTIQAIHRGWMHTLIVTK